MKDLIVLTNKMLNSFEIQAPLVIFLAVLKLMVSGDVCTTWPDAKQSYKLKVYHEVLLTSVATIRNFEDFNNHKSSHN